MSEAIVDLARAEPGMDGLVLLNKKEGGKKHEKEGWRRDSPPAAFLLIEEDVDFDMQHIPREVEP